MAIVSATTAWNKQGSHLDYGKWQYIGWSLVYRSFPYWIFTLQNSDSRRLMRFWGLQEFTAYQLHVEHVTRGPEITWGHPISTTKTPKVTGMYFSVTLGDKVLIQDTSSQSWHTYLCSSSKVYELHIFVLIQQVHLCRKTKATRTSYGVTKHISSPSFSPSRNWQFRWVQSEFMISMMGCHLDGFIF